MPTTTEAIRIFLAPINEPVRGRWTEVRSAEDVRAEMDHVREETGAEELRISDAEGLPSTLIPKYGGVPAQKIAAFVELADMHGAEIARAYVNIFGAEVDVEEWAADAEERVLGIYRDVEEYAYECLEMYKTGDLPSRYLDASAMARDLEASGDIYVERLSASRVAIFRGHI